MKTQKQYYYLIGILILLVPLYLVINKKSDFDIMQQHSIRNLPLAKSSVTKFPATNQKIYLALDESGNIQFFLFIKSKFVTNNVIGNINYNLHNDRDVYWTYFAARR